MLYRRLESAAVRHVHEVHEAMSNRHKQILMLVDPASLATNEVDPIAGVQRYVTEHGLDWRIRVQKQVPLDVLRGVRRVDGVIGRATPRALALMERHRVPTVNIFGATSLPKLPSVILDFEAAGRMAADFLLERGLKQAAFLGLSIPCYARMGEGFASRIESAGGRCLLERTTAWAYEASPATFDRFCRLIHGFVSRLAPPIGILAYEDPVCHHLIDACEERGMRVPDQIAVIGLGNNPTLCQQLTPTLTSIDGNYAAIGYRAAELLAELMKGAKPPRKPILVAPRAVVPRHSTEHLYTDDPLVAQALRHISARHTSRLRPADVARHVATSLRTLQRRFETSLGHSVIREINRQRVRHARQLLVNSDALVKEIARECGFTDTRRLSMAFAELEGMSPADYRRAHRG